MSLVLFLGSWSSGSLNDGRWPPAVLVRLLADRLAAPALLALADLRLALLQQLRESARVLDPFPVNVTLFGSFARGDDDAASDIDLLVVRPSGTDEDDPAWADSIALWEAHARRISGNAVNQIEVGEDEVPKLMRSRLPLWKAIREEGKVLQGTPLAEIGSHARAEGRPKLGGSRSNRSVTTSARPRSSLPRLVKA